ncbi:MAG: 30S ribosomal protein S20 [Clostridia bacterium]|nr:30S ribosomal protein S20 [Clostridia bacterium]
MPNKKSAIKRVRITAKQKLQNQIVRSQMNTAVKKYNAAISEGDVKLAESLLPETSSLIDKAAAKNVIHKNAANHKKAQVARELYQLQNGIIVIKLDSKAQKQAEQKAAAQRKAEEKKEHLEKIKAAKAEKEAAKVAKVAKK